MLQVLRQRVPHTWAVAPGGAAAALSFPGNWFTTLEAWGLPKAESALVVVADELVERKLFLVCKGIIR